MELYNKYRPTGFSRLLGNEETVKILTGMIKADKMPHSVLLLGGSGMGKTSLARIIATRIDCDPDDYKEINGADFNGVATVRGIRDVMGLAPIATCKVYMIDEAHKLTSEAQDILLKMLEEPPPTVYFILATTNPSKLHLTVRNRCTDFRMKPLTPKDMRLLIAWVCTHEQKDCIAPTVQDHIINNAEGSARRALVLLEKVIDIDAAEDAIDVIEKEDSRQDAIEIFRALMSSRTRWPDMVKIIEAVEEEPESLRHLVLACASTAICKPGKGNDRTYLILQAFRDNWYDCKKAGLLASCYEVITTPYK